MWVLVIYALGVPTTKKRSPLLGGLTYSVGSPYPRGKKLPDATEKDALF